ncbi:MAG: hypothetical protein ACTSXC_07600 [Candidatus Freyarchaeota archaeon]
MLMDVEVLAITLNLTRTLFHAFCNAGELELAKMAHQILMALEHEVEKLGGYGYLVTGKACYPYFCPHFKPKKEGKKRG